jgi:hypothetical protein
MNQAPVTDVTDGARKTSSVTSVTGISGKMNRPDPVDWTPAIGSFNPGPGEGALKLAGDL